MLGEFIIGTCLGVIKDREVDFPIEFNVFKNENNLARLMRKEIIPFDKELAEKNSSLPEILVPLGSGVYLAASNCTEYVRVVNFTLSSARAVLLYAGIQIGKYFSRRLDKAENYAIDTYVDQWKRHLINKDDKEFDKNANGLYDYMLWLVEKKKSTAIYTEINDKIEQAAQYVTKYSQIEQLFKLNNQINMTLLNRFCYDKANVFIIHKDDVYVFELNQLDIKQQIKHDKEKVSWNKTIDGLETITNNYGRDKAILIVNAKKDVSLDSKEICAMKLFRKNYEEISTIKEKAL